MRTGFWSTGKGRTLNVVLVLAASALLWEAVVRGAGIKPYLLPTPSAVLVEFAGRPMWYLQHAYYTVMETLIGFAGAVLLGVIMAVGIVYSRWLEQTLYTLLVTLNAIPKIAIAPIFITWLGAGLEPKIVIAVFVAIFPIVIDTVLGLRSVDPEMLNLAKSLGGSRFQVLWKIRAPCALPSLFAGMKVGITLAFIGAIVGEFIAAEVGLGYVVVASQVRFDTPQMFAAISLLALLGLVLFYAIELAENLSVPWHVSHRSESGRAHAPA